MQNKRLKGLDTDGNGVNWRARYSFPMPMLCLCYAYGAPKEQLIQKTMRKRGILDAREFLKKDVEQRQQPVELIRGRRVIEYAVHRAGRHTSVVRSLIEQQSDNNWTTMGDRTEERLSQ